MIYQIAAEAVLILHFLFIGFVLLGGLLRLTGRWVLWVHPPALVWAILAEVNRWICPLTWLEQDLLILAGQSGYEGDFIAHYLLALIYPTAMPEWMPWFLGGLALLINLVVYWLVYRSLRRC